jgi:hypothetical protein
MKEDEMGGEIMLFHRHGLYDHCQLGGIRQPWSISKFCPDIRLKRLMKITKALSVRLSRFEPSTS